eukprot:scaffold28513_cov32-Tisochrysis_lutea.AAC.5
MNYLTQVSANVAHTRARTRGGKGRGTVMAIERGEKEAGKRGENQTARQNEAGRERVHTHSS